MKFEKSGLPDHALVKKAFELGWNNQKENASYQIEHAMRDIDYETDARKRQLSARGSAGQIPLDRVLHEQRKLDEQKEQVKKQAVEGLTAASEQYFMHNIVGPARLAVKVAENPTPQLVAAALLRESVRSPVDFETIRDDFGTEVSDILKNYMHLEAYPTEKEKKLPAASEDVKRMSLIMAIGSMQSMLNVADKVAQQMLMEQTIQPGQEIKVMMVGGDQEARRMVRTAELVRGTDKKLDEQFVAFFNKLSTKVDIGIKVEVGADNKLIVKEVPREGFDNMINGGGPGGPFMGGSPNVPPPDQGGGPSQRGGGGGKGYGKI